MAVACIEVIFWLDSKPTSSAGSLGQNLNSFFSGVYKGHWVSTWYSSSMVSTPKLSLQYTHHRSALGTRGTHIDALLNIEIVSTYS